MKKPHKIIIAIDSFKGSMSSLEAGNAARAGVLECYPEAEAIVLPLADGGEGTTDTLISGMAGKEVSLTVRNPLGRPVKACYGILPDGTAVMEMASACGLTLLREEERNPLLANTYGLGQMLMDAYDRGCRDYLIGIGGSATSEAGIGMLSALGFRFLDDMGMEVPPQLSELGRIHSIDAFNVHKEILRCNFRIACDVSNPLCGERGTIAVYGPQKGVREDQIHELDAAIANFARVAETYKHSSCMEQPGTGAAGGLGFAFLNFFENASLQSGSHIIFNMLQYEEHFSGADLVLTGEGRLDSQTFMNKGPGEVARLAHQHGAKVYAFAGSIREDAYTANREGLFDCLTAITPEEMSLAQAMKTENACENMKRAVRETMTANT